MDPANLHDLVPKLVPDQMIEPATKEIRNIGADAKVTRIGPSPTGMMHVGTLYVAIINLSLAKNSGGISYLRIEDTDSHREVKGATEFIFDTLRRYDLDFDEGPHKEPGRSNAYGPYLQSKRKNFYCAYVRQLLASGRAYPCFCTPEELASIRAHQESAGLRTGYYGKWAKWRDAKSSSVAQALSSGLPHVIRFRSEGHHSQKVTINDAVFGQRSVAQNDQDIVLLKSDGMPTYHLAHVIDDHLMRTTHVVRGEEWLPSLPLHLQLFKAFEWTPPIYGHVASIHKLDGKARRKLSKRKDPDASLSYFHKQGYPEKALLDYLMLLASSKFEGWRDENPETKVTSFPLELADLQAGGGPLLDYEKLKSISRNFIAGLTSTQVYERLSHWAIEYDPEFFAMIDRHADYTRAIVGIERGGTKPRKDVATWSALRDDIAFFFDDWFGPDLGSIQKQIGSLSRDEIILMCSDFSERYDPRDNRDRWFEMLKSTAAEHGFAVRARDFKKNPEAHKGTIADAALVFRLLLTGRPITPDLFSIMQVLGSERVRRRLTI